MRAYSTSLISIVALALALGFAPLNTANAKVVPTQEAQRLALELAVVGGADERLRAGLQSFETLLTDLIAQGDFTDIAQKSKLATVVHEAFTATMTAVIDADHEAWAENFSEHELTVILAFLRSDAGQMELANLPALHQALAHVITNDAGTQGDEAQTAYDTAPQAKRDAVERIFVAQDLENHTRAGFKALGLQVDASLSSNESGGLPTSPPDPAKEQALDDYVERLMQAERGYYVSHFTTEQLAAAADYLESDVGQAVLSRTGVMSAAVYQVLRDQLGALLPTLPARICEAVTCSEEARARLESRASFFANMPALGLWDPGN